MNKSEVSFETISEMVCEVLSEARPKPVCAYIFGSFARGTARIDSDVDVASLFRVTPTPTLSESGFGLQSHLEGALGRPVDLIVLNKARPELVHSILSEGHLLYDDDPAFRIEFEVKSRRDYQDVLPYLREYRYINESKTQ